MGEKLFNTLLFVFIIVVTVFSIYRFVSTKHHNDIDQIIKTLEIDEKDIPTIRCPDILEQALLSADGCRNNPLKVARKIVNAYQTASANGRADPKNDLRTISLHFHKLLTIIDPTIITTKYTGRNEKILPSLRNTVAHDNYFYLWSADARNVTEYLQLHNELCSTGLILSNIEVNDWIIWNLYHGLNICFVISDEKLRALFQKFKIDCKKMVEKSKKN